MASPPIVIHDENDLKRVFEQFGDEKMTINLDTDLTLSGDLKLAGTSKAKPSVEIVGPELKPGGQPTVRLRFPIDKMTAASRFGLVIDGANVMFKNIGFEIIAADPVEPHRRRGHCGSRQKRRRIRHMLVRANRVQERHRLYPAPFPGRFAGHVTPRRCVRCEKSRPAQSDPKKLLFPPRPNRRHHDRQCQSRRQRLRFHTLGALFHVKGGGEANITLEHCSAYLNNGPAFRVDDETACRLKVDYCLFSVPENAARADNPDLIRQTDSSDPSKILYKGQSNGYHNLNSLWVQTAKEGAKDSSSLIAFDDLKSFRQKVELKKGGYDKDSQIIAKESLPFLNEAVPPDNYTAAFELNESVTQLQLPAEKHSPMHPMLGIRKCLAFDMKCLPPLPPELSVASEYKLAPNEKVVDPDYVGRRAGYTSDLLEAMANIHANDIITLKPGAANKEFTLKRQDLEFDLTVRGYPGTFPTVTLADTLLGDAYLFRLLDGKLHLENLHLVIEPKEANVSLSLVNMVGNGTCSVKNCVITLKPRDRANPRAFPLSVVSMVAGEDAKAMMNDTRPALSTAMVKLQSCFVRGEADVLTLRGSRPVTLQVSNSLLFIGGSLGAPAARRNQRNHQSGCRHCRAHEGFGLFLRRPPPLAASEQGHAAYQHPLRIEQAESCLFATLADRPLAFFETPDINDKTLSQYFEWRNHQGNAFVQFNTAYLLEQAADDGLRMLHLDAAEWKETIERESDSQFLPMGFKSLPPRPLNLALPEDAVIRSDFQTELLPFFVPLPKFCSQRTKKPGLVGCMDAERNAPAPRGQIRVQTSRRRGWCIALRIHAPYANYAIRTASIDLREVRPYSEVGLFRPLWSSAVQKKGKERKPRSFFSGPPALVIAILGVSILSWLINRENAGSTLLSYGELMQILKVDDPSVKFQKVAAQSHGSARRNRHVGQHHGIDSEFAQIKRNATPSARAHRLRHGLQAARIAARAGRQRVCSRRR